MVEIERLDRRAHLSVTKFADAGGLPRQLTAVGDVVYFAVDSKADGHLSYVDLVGVNAKTNARTSIRRDDGSKFGKVEYTLASVDNRLRITELLGKGKTAEWSLKPGDTKAKQYVAPKSPVSKDLAAGYAATATPWTNRTAFASGRGIYTLNASTGRTYAVNVPFEKHLDHVVSIGAVGDKLIVDAVHKDGDKLYVVDRTTGVGGRFRPSQEAGDATLVRTVSAGVLVQAKVGYANRLFLTDGTTAGTVAVTDFVAKFAATAEMVEADAHTIYFSNHAITLDPTDPERAGPYIAPGSTAGSGDFSSIGMSASVGYDDTGIFKLDLNTKTLTKVVYQPDANALTVVGDSLYYTVGTETKPLVGDVYSRGLHRLHMPSGTDAYIGSAFEGAVYANGTPIVVNTATSTTLDTGSPDSGSLQVDVFRDDAHANSFDSATRASGFEFYIDRNHDGKRQKNESLEESQSFAGGLIFTLAPGKYDIRLIHVDGWTATRGWSKTITVRGGQPNVVQFGLADDLKTGAIAAGFKKFKTGKAVWIDADDDGILDAGERMTTTSATGTFRFDGLVAGTYVVRRDGDAAKYYATIQLPGETVSIY